MKYKTFKETIDDLFSGVEEFAGKEKLKTDILREYKEKIYEIFGE